MTSNNYFYSSDKFVLGSRTTDTNVVTLSSDKNLIFTGSGGTKEFIINALGDKQLYYDSSNNFVCQAIAKLNGTTAINCSSFTAGKCFVPRIKNYILYKYTTNETISTSAGKLGGFSTLVSASGSDISFDTPNLRFKISTTALYRVYGRFVINKGGSATSINFLVYINGVSAGSRSSCCSSVTAGSSTCEIELFLNLNANDYVEIYGSSNGGVSTIITTGTRLLIERMS